MKKIIAALSVALIASLGIQSMAQNPVSDRQPRKEKKEIGMKEGKRDKAPRSDMAFEGITLTAEQQSQIDALKKENVKDSTKVQLKKQQRDDMRKALLQRKINYLESMKKILTPEQYVKFLENKVIYGQQFKRNPRMPKKDARPRGMKHGHGNGPSGHHHDSDAVNK